MMVTPGQKFSGLIPRHPFMMLLLDHIDVGFPLHEKTIGEVSIEKKINTDLLLTFVNLYMGSGHIPQIRLSFSDSHFIVNYLKRSHAYYLDEIYPDILKTIRRMNEMNKHKEAGLVGKFFETYFDEVKEHLEYEDVVVFPYILNLFEQINQPHSVLVPSKYSVEEYRDHHNDIEEKLDDLKNLLVKYLPEQNDRAIRRNLIFRLFELEYDLNIHSKIEDLILIPLVSQMEDYLKHGK